MTWTELHEACEHQDAFRIIKASNQHGEYLVEMDEHGWNPLHILCLGNPSIEAVQALLSACPQSASDKDANGNTPLHLACSCRETDKHLVRLILETCPTAASITNREGLMPLHMVCRHAPDNKEVIAVLIDAYPYALRACIKMGSIVPHLKCGDPLKDRKPTDHIPLDPSGGMASRPCVDIRYDAVRGQVRDGAYPLHMALVAGAPLEVIEMLVEEAKDILLETNKFGETPLHLALKHDLDDEIIYKLLQSGPMATRICDKAHKNTPAHVAAAVGCSRGVAVRLLETWPEAKKQLNADGLTPHDLADSNGSCAEDVVQLFDATTV